jgi:outer membrane translocation and assembly module TamA
VLLEPPEAQIQAVRDRKTAAILIAVAEGPRCTAGKEIVKMARALAPETLRLLSPLRKGQPYSPPKSLSVAGKGCGCLSCPQLFERLVPRTRDGE